MAIGRGGARASQLQVCRDAAAIYQLDYQEASQIIDATVATIRDQWTEAADAARLTELDRAQLWENQILNPYIFYG